ncbi:MogA/MoaB family molybdenum cofactor biosynthesis protein [Halogeometricum luteum]|uniref:MogA/MoaB family molybdenum cofactor biosynthesis protein n=1 Tax=Halogeometricum luteum TaxID=2950537 RepID=A0ABU2G0Z6_9EURY|nr:MogA/MoaB family molybdenum cofactor biosynthesis protein [Halogeometricum sp. S3BR5-2]MDS0294457.1 MogA/MoaB family molybdenum cofactor biosynthesis protein [Halogeometricum sp. S3BR5-2]
MSEHGHDGIGSAGDSHNHREHHDGQRTDEGGGSEGEGGDGDGEGHDHEHDHEHEHDHHHDHDVSDLGVGIVTVSTSRSIEDDPAGDAIRDAFEDGGHQVTVRELIDDSFDGVQSTVNRLVDRDDVDIVVTTGGTGVTPDDVTVEAVADLMHKTLPGFGELFRRLSYDEIGTRVVGTRTTAGIADHTPVFCLPGSENAARLGAEEILVPEAPHLAGLATRE